MTAIDPRGWADLGELWGSLGDSRSGALGGGASGGQAWKGNRGGTIKYRGKKIKIQI